MERKEAITIVKNNWPNKTRTMLREALETLIPELVESENKMTRRCISDVVRKYGVEFATGTITKEKMLAWLEKQDDQSDIKWEPHKGDRDNPYDMSFVDAQQYVSNRGCDFSINDNNIFVDRRYITQTTGNILRWADDHPKQVINTPEWTDEDTHTLNWICRIIYRAKQDRLITPEDEIFLGHWIDKWLDPSSEWNESGKKMLKSIIECIDGTGLLDSDQIDWLKSLKFRCDSRIRGTKGDV